MKSLKALLAGAVLACTTFAAQPTLPEIVGRYDLTTNPNTKIIIDAQGRLKTNVMFQYNNGAAQAPLVFTRFLKQDDFTDAWSTNGQVAMQYLNQFGQVFQCNFPVKFEASFSPDLRAMDVTLTHAQTVSVDAYGRCLAVGSIQEFMSFDRE